MEPSIEGVLTICSKGSAQLNSLAAMPYMVKKLLKIFFSRTKTALRVILGIQQWGLKVYQICSNNDRWLTFDLFT